MTGYEELAQQPLGDNILAQIAQTARDILAAREAVSGREEELRQAQQHLRTLQEEVLPELMSEAGQEQLTTADGLKVSIKEVTRGQPTKANEAEAFAWLRDNGQGGIIKSEVTAKLGKGDDEKAQEVLTALTGMGVNAGLKSSVHWQTLGALVRELLAKGENVPLDLLGVHIWKQADVKPAK